MYTIIVYIWYGIYIRIYIYTTKIYIVVTLERLVKFCRCSIIPFALSIYNESKLSIKLPAYRCSRVS